MKFGNKLEYAKHLAACLAYVFSLQQDLAGLVAIDDAICAELPAGTSAAHMDRLFRQLENWKQEREPIFAAASRPGRAASAARADRPAERSLA